MACMNHFIPLYLYQVSKLIAYTVVSCYLENWHLNQELMLLVSFLHVHESIVILFKTLQNKGSKPWLLFNNNSALCNIHAFIIMDMVAFWTWNRDKEEERHMTRVWSNMTYSGRKTPTLVCNKHKNYTHSWHTGMQINVRVSTVNTDVNVGCLMTIARHFSVLCNNLTPRA